MPSPKHILRKRWAPALALLGTLAVPGLARADFQITYVFTDGDGEPQPQLRLTSTDMSAYSNQASCQCGHLWGARVFLNNQVGTSYPLSTQIRTYVGANCELGQNSVGQQQFPCVKVFEGLANDYDDGGILLSFEQIWLSSRVQSLSMQAVESAEPRLPCDPSQTGGGGIWICVESNGQPDCQGEEFVIKGDQSVNGSSSGGTGGTGSTGGTGMDTGAGVSSIQYDYVPPQSEVSGFQAEPGDGKVVISWTRAEVPDISGFRALCATMDGEPAVTGKITGVPTGRSRTNGKLYYTADNLCGADVVHEPDPDATETDGSTSTGDTDTTDGSTSGPIRTSTSTGIGMSSTTGASSGSGTTDGTGGDLADSVLANLDWAFVCSDHVSATGTKIEITGLANDTEYQMIVVAYDNQGNPRIMSDLLTATPIETSDFWEQCEQQGDLCGSGGFCNCTSEPEPMNAAWLGTGLLALALRRRRREPIR